MPKCQLNSDFFDDNNQMLPDVREVLVKIIDDVTNGLKEDHGFILIYRHVILTGSLTGPNYDDESDVDLHFMIDYNDYEVKDKELIEAFLSYFKISFNDKNYTILGHDLEIYFQDINEPHASPGTYDVIEDKWIKDPDCVEIEFTDDHKEKAREYLDQITEFRSRWDNGEVEDKENFIMEIKKYLEDIMEYRSKGVGSSEESGMYSFENMVFKWLRRNGTLRQIVDLKHDVMDSIYDVER